MGIFDSDYSLPSLPVPDIENTCIRLTQSIKPLVSPEVWAKTLTAIEKLPSQAGALQDLLLKHRDSLRFNSSWLRPLWDDVYLSYRGTLPVNMNYCYEFDGKRWGEYPLAALIASLCRVIGEIRDGSLKAEATKAGFLSMDALLNVFYTRIPSPVRDVLYSPQLAAPLSVAVACKGRWFIMSAVNEQGKPLPPPSIWEALCTIKKQAARQTDQTGEAVPVGSLTAAERPNAAKLQDELSVNPMNRMNLSSIANCVFAVCLDDEASGDDFAASLVGGDSANRWFDKSLQIVSGPEQRLGVNLEHSGCDGSMWLYVLNRADSILCEDGFASSFEKASFEKASSAEGAAHVRALQWNIGKDLAASLNNVRETFANTMKSMTIKQRSITSVSKNIIKPKNCSPDAFVQMLYQAAYYKEKRFLPSVYEAVSTRAFYQGRTECARPVTEASKAFITSLYEGGESAQALLEKFRLAEQAHVQGLGHAQKAQGAERHISGLQYMHAMYSGDIHKPDIFDDEGFRTLKNDVLSTSSVTAPYIEFFGFAPVVQEGLGLGYGLRDDSLAMMVCAYEKSGIKPDTFLDNMEEAAKRFLEIL